ncbi:nicotinamide-nucleotide adenylyltransferase [Rhodotorula paludigena]|uniref:nicotinamide-nucleotide adenylyltransferase n=1 Tax=Rhodotorula paludigena TaxID=86838 RepID=UPI0031728242
MAPRLPLPTSSAVPVLSLLPTSHTPFKLVYASHGRWPLLPDAEQSSARSPTPLRISVLDSSFNPPHLAHLSLAQHGDYDAHLLALTIGNPDKGRLEQSAVAVRVEMMRALALDLQRRAGEPGGKKGWANVAVAVMEAPTFTSKSRILREELDALAREQTGRDDASVRLTFPVGWDTVIRIFAPRYYQPPNPDLASSMHDLFGTDDSSVTCARRGDISRSEESEFLAGPEVQKWARQGKVELFDLPDEARAISSTAIRAAVQEDRWDDVARSIPVKGIVDIVRRDRLYRQ